MSTAGVSRGILLYKAVGRCHWGNTMFMMTVGLRLLGGWTRVRQCTVVRGSNVCEHVHSRCNGISFSLFGHYAARHVIVLGHDDTRRQRARPVVQFGSTAVLSCCKGSVGTGSGLRDVTWTGLCSTPQCLNQRGYTRRWFLEFCYDTCTVFGIPFMFRRELRSALVRVRCACVHGRAEAVIRGSP